MARGANGRPDCRVSGHSQGTPKRRPAPVAAGSGLDAHKTSTVAANCNPWQRWAANARLERLSARQRRAAALLATGLAPNPERALKVLGGRV